MRSATSIVLLALLASPALSAPLSLSKPSSSSTSSGIGAAVAGGAASGAVGNLLSKIESLFRREDFDGLVTRDFKSTIASLSPQDKATVKAALVNKISTLKDSDLAARGVGASIGGAVAGGAASAVVGNLLSEIESLFRRTAPVEEEPPAPEDDEPSTGSQIAAAAAGGAASGAVGNILNKIEGFFGINKRGVFDEEIARRDLASIAKAIPSLSAADKATVKTALINKISTLKNQNVAARGVGASIGGAVAGGAASAVVGNLLSEIESLFRRTAPVEEEPPAPEDDEPSTGSQIAAAAAGGAASGAVGNILNKIEGFFGINKRGVFDEEVARRDLASIAKAIPSLSAADKATVKTALINKISTLKNQNVAARGVGASIGGAVAGGAASAVVGNLLSEIESLFRRGAPVEEEEPSTGSQIAAAAAGGAASGAVGNILNKIEGFFGIKRGVFDEKVARRDLASIAKAIPSLSATDKATVKAALVAKISTLKNSDVAARGVGASIGGAVAGGAASAVVGNLLSEIESLFRRSEESEIAARGFGGAIGGAVAGGAASAVVGNLLSQIESLFRRDFEERDFKSTIASLSPADKATVKAALVNKISTLKDSDLAARGVGSAIGGSIAGGAASAVVGNLLSQIESLFRRDEIEQEMARRGFSLGKTTGSSTASSIGAAAAGGAASGLVGNLLNEIEGLFRRSDESELAARGFGGAIGGAVAGGAASAVVGNLLSQIESLFRRDFEERDFKSTIASLSPQDKATVKAALVNKISTLKDSDLAARGVGSAIGGSIAGGAASAVVGNLLSEIEGLFRREEILARSDMWNVNELD